MLKLTTDRHEASRGLFATAELLVILLYFIFTYSDFIAASMLINLQLSSVQGAATTNPLHCTKFDNQPIRQCSNFDNSLQSDIFPTR